MTLAKLAFGTLLCAIAAAQTLRADDLDYSVGDHAPATIKVAGDGTVFVEYVAPQAGATYRFTMYVWVESGHAAASFPTPACPVRFMRLSGFDATGWFASDPTQVAFVGYGTDPTPSRPADEGYTGIPGGSYRAVTVSFTVPGSGLPDQPVQVKVKARTQGIPHLGEAHGVIVRISSTPDDGGGGGGECDCCRPAVTAWLSTGDGIPLAED